MESFTRLDDDSIMTFGAHKGKTLENVPANYLLWLEGELKKSPQKYKFNNGLLVYINENRQALENE